MIKENTCAFTGHRELEKNFDCAQLKARIEEYIRQGYDTFLSGMAVGFDMLAAQTVLDLKDKYPSIRLIACIPCKQQSRYYSAEEKLRYEKILSFCDQIKILSDGYYQGCMQSRDRYMVDNSSLLIAYKRKNSGGTYYTVKYALSENKRICLI